MNERSVESLLAYYRRQVSDDLALTYSVADQFPVEILNELRNALGHISRAAAPDCRPEERQKQLLNAEQHLLRVRLDCAKLNLLIIDEELDADLRALTQNVKLPGALSAESQKLKSARKELMVRESDGPADGLADAYLALFEEADEFRTKLRTEYSELVSGAYRAQYKKDMGKAFNNGVQEGKKENWRRGLITGIIGSLAAAAILALLSWSAGWLFWPEKFI